MNSEHMNVVLAWLAQRIVRVEGFVLEQAPDVIQQIITMDFVQAISVALCLAMAVPFVAGMAWLAWKSSSKVDDWNRTPVRVCIVVIGGGALIALAVISAIHSVKAAKIHCAPKAYLLERVGVLK